MSNKRLFDSAAWMSDKVKAIQPAHWRAEFAWLYSIALADGTFEADPHKIWVQAYAHARPEWAACTKTRQSPNTIALLLTELARVGLLECKTDTNGKVWGRWVGSEKYLPAPSARHKYKQGNEKLFTISSGNLADIKPEANRGVGVGVGLGLEEGVGVGLGNQNQNQPRCFSETPEGQWLKTLGSKTLEEIVAKAKRFTKQLIGEWQAIHGPAAILNYPDRDRDAWEWLCENVDNAILLEAFRKWARTARRTDKWALGEFARRYEEFTDKIVVAEDPQVLATRQHSEDLDLRAAQERAAAILKAQPKAAEPGGFEEYLAELPTTEQK